MNGANLHLAINHIPVLITPVGFLLLAGGLIRKSKDLVQAGYLALVLVAILAYPVERTGGMAAQIIRSLPGIERAQIHEHAEAADYVLWPAAILGTLSLFGLWKTQKSGGFPKGLTLLVLIGSLFLTTVVLRVAHLGGLIRHPEIAKDYVAAPPRAQK